MRSTKLRILDRYATEAFLVLALLMGGACAVACGNDEAVGFNDDDAGTSDAETGDAATAPGDERDANTAADAGYFPVDAGPFDAAVREVTCESATCATALTQTVAYSPTVGQGFCALLSDGTVACWGANTAGQLGSSDAGAPTPYPQRDVGVSNAVSVKNTCAIDKDGAAWCWGNGSYLQVENSAAPTTEWVPVKLPIPPATQIAKSASDACAVIDGQLQCWGGNYQQILPVTGTPGSAVLQPTPIPISIPVGVTVRDIALSDFAVFVLLDNGTLLGWGKKPELGRLTSLPVDYNPDPLELANVTSLSVGRSRGDRYDYGGQNMCAVADGIPYCWGVAVPAPNGTVDQTNFVRAVPQPVVTPERVVQISNSDLLGSFAAALPARWCAVGASGAVYCWGNNATGQAGDGTTDYAFEAVKVPLPAPAVHVEVTADSTCALLVNGKIQCWGGNIHGQLGNGKGKQASLVPSEVVLP